MRFNDSVIGLFAIIVGIVVFIHVQSFPAQADGRAGPALFPTVLSILFVVAGAVLVRDGRRSAAPLWQLLPDLDAKGISNILLTLGAIVFYILVSDKLGFLLSSFIVMATMMLMLKARAVIAMPVAAGTTLCIYAMFNKLLLVPLPRGIFSF